MENTMTLKEKLITIPQREKSGEDSESAFAYQKNWAFYHLLKLHINNDNYVFVFEFHDDILLLDSIEPTNITFIQIKKSDNKAWTISRLLKKDANTLSILGKLFIHCKNFNGEKIFLKSLLSSRQICSKASKNRSGMASAIVGSSSCNDAQNFQEELSFKSRNTAF